jgi:hypothetical protein
MYQILDKKRAMSFTLVKSFPRLWSLEAGRAMVVTDIHGDWDVYQRYRDRFVKLQAAGRVDCLIFLGDLIHAESDTQRDRSVDIVLDVLALQAEYGTAVLCLCGNHEMPHIYGISLARASREYTAGFEAAMSQSGCRPEVMAFFDSLPFYIRSRGGVSLAHAGASPAMLMSQNAARLFNWSHQELLRWAEQSLDEGDLEAMRRGYVKLSREISYDQQAKHYLAVSGSDDPRYDHLLRGFLATAAPSFQLLWSSLFTRCEKEFGAADYALFLDAMLKELSAGFSPQQVLVSGHISTREGHKIIAHRQLRLSSAHHAQPPGSGRYLIFDAARPVYRAKDMLAGLESVYES